MRGPGRPPKPWEPASPDPWTRQEYVDRLRTILDALEIGDLAQDSRLYLQRMLRRYDVLRAFDGQRFTAAGEQEATLLLRLVAESTNGPAALTAPILRAMDGCHKPWVERTSELFEAFDATDLVKLHDDLVGLGLEDQLERTLRRKLEGILGAAVEHTAA
jgi:hypothetical protein